MTTDNRTNHEIVAQVLEEHGKCYEYGVLPTGFMEDQILRELRAAGRLVAAQGAAPRVESGSTHRGVEPDTVMGGVACSECGWHLGGTGTNGDIQGRQHAEAISVLPSSGVDEDKLAEVIGGVLAGQEAMHCNRVWEAWGHGTMSEDDFSLVSDDEEAVTEIARAVIASRAEWLKGESK